MRAFGTAHRVANMVLSCVECGCLWDDEARGWWGLRALVDDTEQTEALTFCPVCAEREFGLHPRARRKAEH